MQSVQDLVIGATMGSWPAAFTMVGVAAAVAWCIVAVVREVRRPFRAAA